MYKKIKTIIKAIVPRSLEEARVLYEQALIGMTFFLIPLVMSQSLRDNYTIIKWKIVHLFAVLAVFQLFFVYKKLLLPNLGKWLSYAFLTIMGIWGWEYYFHRIPFFSDVTIDRMAFLGLTLFFYKQLKERPQTLDVISYALLASMGVFAYLIFSQNVLSFHELFSIDLSPAIRKKIQFTFGNENMAAQFFSVAALCALREIFLRKTLWLKAAWGTLFIIVSLFLLKSGCRSALVGLGMGAAFYGSMRCRPPYRVYLLKASIVLGIGLFSIMLLVRPQTVHHRQEMWSNAFSMIKDYPLGIGRERFNFYHVLYQDKDQIQPRSETLVERTPHNEILKYLVEEGWIFVGAVLIFLLLFLRTHGSILLDTLKRQERLQLMGGLFFILSAEFFFQFPFEVAFPYLMLCCFSGYILSVLPQGKGFTMPPAIGVPLFFIFLMGTSFLYIANLGHGSERFYKFLPELGCRLAPYEWRTCDQYIRHLEREQSTWIALEEEFDQLALRPYSFLSVLQVGRAYFMLKEREKSCKFAWFYDRLFDSKSNLRSFILQNCPESEQTPYLSRSLKDHYKGLFDHLPEDQQRRLTHNT